MRARPINLGPQYAVDINFDKAVYVDTSFTTQVTRVRQSGERTDAQPNPDLNIVLECYNEAGVIISSTVLASIAGTSWTGTGTIVQNTRRAVLRLVYPFSNAANFSLRYSDHQVIVSIDPTNRAIPDYGEKVFVFKGKLNEPPIYRFAMVQRSLALTAIFAPPVSNMRRTLIQVMTVDQPAGLPFGFYATLIARSNNLESNGQLVHFGPEGAAAAEAAASADGVAFNPIMNNYGGDFTMGLRVATDTGAKFVELPYVTQPLQGKTVKLFAIPPNTPSFEIGIWWPEAYATSGHAYDYIAMYAFRSRNLPPVGMSTYRIDPYQPFRVSTRLQGGNNLPVSS